MCLPTFPQEWLQPLECMYIPGKWTRTGDSSLSVHEVTSSVFRALRVGCKVKKRDAVYIKRLCHSPTLLKHCMSWHIISRWMREVRWRAQTEGRGQGGYTSIHLASVITGFPAFVTCSLVWHTDIDGWQTSLWGIMKGWMVVVHRAEWLHRVSASFWTKCRPVHLLFRRSGLCFFDGKPFSSPLTLKK